jgi:hypothetical protein
VFILNLRRASLFVIATLFTAIRAFAQPAGTLRLPPSLERELKLRGSRTHVVRFSDTVKAEKLISASIRDSSAHELDSTSVHDSAIVIIDSAVSLTEKERLDSMLAELPETERTPEGLRFHYPDKMMVNTARREVPFDTTLTRNMDPVSKEDLPLFDGMPSPKPFIATPFTKYDVLLTVGTPYLPSVIASVALVSNPHSTVDVGGSYIRRSSDVTALGDEWGLRVNGIFTFESDNIAATDPKPIIRAELSTRSTSRFIKTDNSSSDYALARNRLDGSFAIGSLSAVRATGNASVHFTSDNAGASLSERSGGMNALFEHEANDSTNRHSLGLKYDGASESPIAMKNAGALGALTAEALFSSSSNSSFNYKAGLTFILASDASASNSYVFPKLRIGKQFSTDFELFGELSREASVRSYDALYAMNPFYTPMLAENDSAKAFTLSDGRRVTVDKYKVTLGANYFLSQADQLQFGINIGERHHEVAFRSLKDSSGVMRYYADAVNSKFYDVTANGSLLFFKKDRLQFSVLFASDVSTVDNKQLPYLPTFITEASYLFASVSDNFIPSVGFKTMARQGKSFMFLNAGAKYKLSSNWSLELRLDNIGGSDGAYWEPYNEYPRQVSLGLHGRF